MKKRTKIFIATLMLISSIIGLVACGEESHTHTYSESIIEATCTEGGYTLYTCSCGDSYKGNYTNALGHSFTNYISNGDADCYKDGTKTAKCDRCEVTDTMTESGSKLKHNYIEKITKPTCTEGGYTTYTCSYCKDSYVGKNTQPLNHDYKGVETKPTCTEKGYTTFTCSRCQDSYIDNYVKETGHDFGDWMIMVEATEETSGLKCRICKNDSSHMEEEVIPQAEHVHKYVETTVDATCTESGYSIFTCRCGDSYKTITSQPLNHDYKSVTVNPTCLKKGYTVYTCNRCHDRYTSDYVDIVDHKFTNYVSNNDATFDEDGTKTAKCDYDCGTTDTIVDENSRFCLLTEENLGSMTFGINSSNKVITLSQDEVVRCVYLDDQLITSGYSVESGEITISGTMFSSNGKYTVKIVATTILYTIDAEVFDYVIGTKEEFVSWYKNYSENYNKNSSIILTDNIDLGETKFEYESGTERCNLKFNGTFDGRGYNIANFTTYYGFMSTDESGVIKNVSFTNFVNTNVKYSGGFFAKFTFGTLQNIYVEGEFTAGEMTYSQGALGYKSNEAKEITNIVIILHQTSGENKCTDKDDDSYIIGQYMLGSETMYVVNEIATKNIAKYGKNLASSHAYTSVEDFKSEIKALPAGFSSTYWTMYKGVLVMKNAESFYSSRKLTAITMEINDGTKTILTGEENSINTNMTYIDFKVSGLTESQYTLSNGKLIVNDTVENGTVFSITAYYYAYGIIYVSTTVDNLVVENNYVETKLTFTINDGSKTIVAGETNTLTTNIEDVSFSVEGLNPDQYTLSGNTFIVDSSVSNGTTFSITAYYYAYGTKYVSATVDNLVVANSSKNTLSTVILGKNRTNDTFSCNVGSGEAISSFYIDGKEKSTSLLSIESGVLTVPATSFDSGEHTVKITTTSKIITFPIVVADYAIGTATEFANWYNNYSDYWDKYIALTDNITLNIATRFTSPTDIFSGTFNGNGYTIYNFYSTQGLFYALSGTFKNTAVVNTKTEIQYLNFMGYNLAGGKVYDVFYQGTQSGSWDDLPQVPAFYTWGVNSSSVKNVVVIVDRNTGNSSDPISTLGGNGVLSLYVVNNCSRGATTTTKDSNYYSSIAEFMNDVTSVPAGFDTDIWTMNGGLLTFKSTANIVGSISVYLNRTSTIYNLEGVKGKTVSSVYVNGTKIATTKYFLSNGIFKISSGAFTSSGDKIVTITTNVGKYIIYAEVIDYAIGSVAEFTTWYSKYSTFARGIDLSDSSVDTYGKNIRVVLTADIDFKGATISNAVTNYWWKSDVGGGNAGNLYFIGSFDGRGYTLSNFTSKVGLFPGVTASGVIKNLNIKNFTITEDYGLLGNTFNGTMLNCNIEGKVNSTKDLNGSLWNNVGENAIIKNVNVTVTSDNNNSSVYGVSSEWQAVAGNVVGLIVVNDNCNNICAENNTTIQGVKLAKSLTSMAGYNMLDYKIVCANDSGNMIKASKFVATHFNTAIGTGITTLSSVSNWSDSDKLIIFGNETLFKEQLANAGKTFNENAYYILKVGNTVFIYASDSADYNPASIKFLELFIGFEDYGNSTFEYTNIPNEMPEMYYENVVTFKNRITGFTQVLNGQKTMTKASDSSVELSNYNELESMGYCTNLYMSIPNRYYYEGLTTDKENYGTRIQSHSVFYILPPEMYQKTHGAFYSTTCKNFDMASSSDACNRDYNQLCYTARSDDYPGELEVMKETVLDYLKVVVKLSYNINLEYLPIHIMDNAYYCQCSACKRVGAVKSEILFMNDIVNRLNDWLHSDEGGNDSRTIKISILAYKGFVYAPTDGTTCNENVVVQLAPIEAYYGKAITDSSNSACRKNIEDWAVACADSELHVWLYQVHFSFKDYGNKNTIGGYMLPLDSWEYTVGWYKFLKENGVTQIFNQGAHSTSVLTGFGYLKNYIDSKAEIDVDYVIENFDTIITNYFNNYFGSVAGAKMKEFYEAYKTVIRKYTSTGALREYVFDKITYSDVSSLNTKLNAVYVALDNAYSDKTDANYLAYKNRIDIESISLRFLVAEKGWSGSIKSSYYLTTKAGVYSDMVSLGFSSYAEGSSLADLKTYWGV